MFFFFVVKQAFTSPRVHGVVPNICASSVLQTAPYHPSGA